MKVSEVPQDAALLGGHHEISYAIDENGRYVLTPSAGWEPANLANAQAWEKIAQEIRDAMVQVKSGQASPLLFHMVRHQMDIGLLAGYMRLARWKVRRHLHPDHYKKLTPELRQRYAQCFGIQPEQLEQLPTEICLLGLPDICQEQGEDVALNFVHRQSAHCESGVTANLLTYHGRPMTEALAFGIGGGYFFGYFPFVRINNLPLITFRRAPGSIFKSCCRRLGARVRTRTFKSPEDATKALDQALATGTPQGVQTGVYWLPYFPPALRFHFNAHNLVVYGKDGDDYLISDPVFESPVRCAKADLERARFARGALAPKGRMYAIEHLDTKRDLQPAVLKGIREVANRMVRAPVPLIGVRGIRFLARQLEKWPEKLGHKSALLHLGHLIRMQEEIGTGGGGFRFIYAAFLSEAADILGRPALRELAEEMTEIGDLWRQFALLAARHCKGREQNPSFMNLANQLRACAQREDSLFRSLLKAV